jgi:hypothetical protein
MGKEQWNHNKRHPYPERSQLAIADSFLERMKRESRRPFVVFPLEVETKGDFPSTYDFRICEFSS